MPELNPQPLPPKSDRNRVRIFVPNEVAYDRDKMSNITASVLDKLGCPGCHSGHVLDFISLQDFVVDPKTLEVQQVAGPQELLSL